MLIGFPEGHAGKGGTKPGLKYRSASPPSCCSGEKCSADFARAAAEGEQELEGNVEPGRRIPPQLEQGRERGQDQRVTL
eukprot:3335945-Rhodomonas_salina.1